MRILNKLFFWCCWPGLFIYFHGSRRSRIIIQKKENTLLVKGWWNRWFADDRWGLPGGGMQRGESPEAAAARELQEELGISVSATDLQCIGEATISEYGLRYRAIFFFCTASVDIPAPVRNHEIRDTAWLPATTTLHLKPEVGRALELLERQ